MIAFGLIGCGAIANRHLRSLIRCPEATLTAVCDVREEAMERVAAEYLAGTGQRGGIARYRDVQDLLGDKSVEAVIIATPSKLHADLAKQAMEAGKHVMLEKPMALSLRDAESIVSLARERKAVVQLCHQLRYKPVMARTKELVSSGAMGRVYLGVVSMRLQRSRSYYEAAPWRGTWEQDGGMLLNQGIHLIDLLQWFMGEPSNVYGRMLRGPIPKQTEDVAAGVIEFEQGGIGVIEANTLTYPRNYDNGITLFGERGTVSIGGITLNEIRKWEFADPIPNPNPGGDEADEHLIMYDQFIRALTGDSSAKLVTAAEGLKVLKLIFSFYHSVNLRSGVANPPPSFATTDMADWEGGSVHGGTF